MVDRNMALDQAFMVCQTEEAKLLAFENTLSGNPNVNAAVSGHHNKLKEELSRRYSGFTLSNFKLSPTVLQRRCSRRPYLRLALYGHHGSARPGDAFERALYPEGSARRELARNEEAALASMMRSSSHGRSEFDEVSKRIRLAIDAIAHENYPNKD